MGRSGPDGRAGWTELFFLDEVTALAAGHRPCFFCRRARAADFLKRFGEAFGLDSPRAPMLDRRLHAERFVSAGPPLPRLDPDAPKVLPDGTMIADDGQAAYALRGDWALPWSFGGYGRAQPRAALRDRPLVLVTPPTTVKVLAAGYQPVWHPSADPA